MKTCNRCGTQNLEWDMHYHEITGKWKLLEHKSSKGKICGRVKQDVFSKTSKKDIVKCPLCVDSSFGWGDNSEVFEIHLEKYHPKGEMLTDLDYVVEHQSEYTTKKFWKRDKNYSRYVD